MRPTCPGHQHQPITSMALPGFKPIELYDQDILNTYLRGDPPQISELTFTNLFIWRHYYRPVWRQAGDCLFIVCDPVDGQVFALPPVGLGNKIKALAQLFDLPLNGGAIGKVSRVGRDFIERYVDLHRYRVEADPDQSDYLYLTQDLINLSGRHLHQKRNHYNHFIKHFSFECRLLDESLVTDVLQMQEEWCQIRDCESDSRLSGENKAIWEALQNFHRLSYRGMAIVINNKIQAFSLGEPLNADTVVIHAEKANPGIRGLYATINQRFCQEVWKDYKYINREQDLGVEGLRQAKKSYNPHRMIEKFNLYLNY